MKRIVIIICILCLCVVPTRAVDYGSPYGGLSTEPAMEMRSTSSMIASGQCYAQTSSMSSSYRGFYTSASSVTGGVTTYDSYNPGETPASRGARRAPMPGTPDIFPTPIDLDGYVMAFMAMMAIGYAVMMQKRKNERANELVSK